MDKIHDNVVIKRETSSKESKVSSSVDNSEGNEGRSLNPRNAKAVSILLVFLALFLFLSLVSYTPRDYIHTRLSFEEYFGLFTGSDIVKAKIDATQNWLGLIGAIISDFCYCSLIGYSILTLPFIIFLLAVELFRNSYISATTKKKAWAVVLLAVFLSSSISAFAGLEWITEISREWYGAVGNLFAKILSSLLGSFGSMLLFLALSAVVLIKLTNVKVDKLFETVFNKGEDKYRSLKSTVMEKKEKPVYAAEEKEPKESIFKKLLTYKNARIPNPTASQAPEAEAQPVHKPTPQADDRVDGNIPKSTEPARIIKGNVEIRVNNPNNKVNPIINDLSASADSKPRSNSLVDKLIEENRISEMEPKNGAKPLKIEINQGGNNSLSVADTISSMKDIEPVEVTIDKNNKVIINESIVEEVKTIIAPETLIEAVNDSPVANPEVTEALPNDNLDYYYDDEVSRRAASLVIPETEEVRINPDDYFQDLPDIDITSQIEETIETPVELQVGTTVEPLVVLPVELPVVLPVEPPVVLPVEPPIELPVAPPVVPDKPLVVTVRDSAPEVSAQVTEKFVNPIGSSILDEEIDYTFPSKDYLEEEEPYGDVDDDELKENAKILQEKLETFKIFIENLSVTPGPVVTQYEFVPAPGIKISRIESLADDIAMALKAKGIRIIAPIPGKGTVGIEIPNKKRTTVRFKSIITSPIFQQGNFALPLAFGRTISGDVFCTDLAKMPHLLIAGSTGAGKSVGINTFITSLLYKIHPKYLKFVIIDPKKVELQQYHTLENHFLAVSPDVNDMIITDPESAVITLKSLCLEMDKRYDILSKVGQRNIQDYNLRIREGKIKDDKGLIHREMPYIVVVIDELADLMLTASKEVEVPIIRLAQLARAIGIHLVVATQRPSVNVITGIIKANFPARIAYMVASKFDSRTILDMGGAEHLLGQGDMLFLPNGTPKPIRLQNAFLSTDEVERVCAHIGNQKGYSQPYLLPSLNENDSQAKGIAREDRDPLFEEAARLIVTHQQGSVSLIQRRLKVGYARAGRIVDELESAGIVGPFDGSKARRVYIETEDELEDYL